jgi:hypothetical protein
MSDAFCLYLAIVIIRNGNCVAEVLEGTGGKASDSMFLICIGNKNKRTGKKQQN